MGWLLSEEEADVWKESYDLKIETTNFMSCRYLARSYEQVGLPGSTSVLWHFSLSAVTSSSPVDDSNVFLNPVGQPLLNFSVL